ncbi:regulator of competence-specific genes [Serratia fonticola]|uniref:Regulator of competence-specific genes n=1 Tax=Serratia fonticola TaxID=47917 RepID=A0A559TD13_SERFO|nr:TfoX/Sxy family DNA transformation protein [Serratia fonticola]TQI79977.1 regulator of competence-specific genes [Serratia fonticola]TQI97997.1 regulator of competence-specific genes [Serratia fonticola]TVZ72492.1 regulator of competence-specific genes [Serratia fonticola]
MKGRSASRIAQAKAYFAALGKIATRSQFGGYGLLADGTMFAVIAEGELYLRATENLEPAFRERGMVNMTYLKRGVPMIMRYYWVDEELWLARRELFMLAQQALREARKEITVKMSSNGRLKDLPNIDASMERLLWRAGIQNSYDLRLLGARNTYLKLLQQQKNLGMKVLLALAGALSGYHQAALPNLQREALTEWFEETVVASCLRAKPERRACSRPFND